MGVFTGEGIFHDFFHDCILVNDRSFINFLKMSKLRTSIALMPNFLSRNQNLGIVLTEKNQLPYQIQTSKPLEEGIVNT